MPIPRVTVLVVSVLALTACGSGESSGPPLELAKVTLNGESRTFVGSTEKDLKCDVGRGENKVMAIDTTEARPGSLLVEMQPGSSAVVDHFQLVWNDDTPERVGTISWQRDRKNEPLGGSVEISRDGDEVRFVGNFQNLHDREFYDVDATVHCGLPGA